MDMKYVIKVADFGLAVKASEDKNYFIPGDESKEKLPVKWLAIESLLDHKFSEASDVVCVLHFNVQVNISSCFLVYHNL